MHQPFYSFYYVREDGAWSCRFARCSSLYGKNIRREIEALRVAGEAASLMGWPGRRDILFHLVTEDFLKHYPFPSERAEEAAELSLQYDQPALYLRDEDIAITLYPEYARSHAHG